MALVDLPLEELRTYKPKNKIPDDLDIFWKEKIDSLRSKPVEYTMEKIDYIVPEINAYRIMYKGYAVFAIDVRGQSGESTDNRIYPGISVAGYMTKGIFNRDDYYYLGGL